VNPQERSEIFGYLINYINNKDKVKRDEKLKFIRNISNLLYSGLMTPRDGLKEWKGFVENYIKDFGPTANKELFLVYKHLLNNGNLSNNMGEDVNSESLSGISWDSIGVTSTGEEGIKQSKNYYLYCREQVFRERNISSDLLKNPITRAMVGKVTGFYSGEWSHGLSRRKDLVEFVKAFNEKLQAGRTPELDSSLEDNEAEISVARNEEMIFSRQRFTFSASSSIGSVSLVTTRSILFRLSLVNRSRSFSNRLMISI